MNRHTKRLTTVDGTCSEFVTFAASSVDRLFAQLDGLVSLENGRCVFCFSVFFTFTETKSSTIKSSLDDA